MRRPAFRLVSVTCLVLRSGCHGAEAPGPVAGSGAAAQPVATDTCHDTLDLGLDDLRLAAWDFYSSSGFSFVVLDLLSSVWQNFEEVTEHCAPAVLTAQLLKAEERAMLGVAAVDEFLVRYAELLQDAVSLGRIEPSDFSRWPLRAGLARVRHLRELLVSPEPSTPLAAPWRVDMVMNFCSKRDRHGTEHALGWLRNEPLRSLLRRAGVRVVLYLVNRPHCDTSHEQFAWLEAALGPPLLQEYRGARRREEQSAYFKYLADNYDDPADFVIFVHPDAPEHQDAGFPALRRALNLLATGSPLAYDALQYYPLALQLVRQPDRTRRPSVDMDGIADDWPDFWHHVFGARENGVCPSGCPWNSEMSDTFQIYVASQAVVGRERIRIHPRSFYAAFARDMEYCGNNSGNFEAAWHVIFGEPLALPRREVNPRVPLALKWGVPTIISEGSLGVI